MLVEKPMILNRENEANYFCRFNFTFFDNPFILLCFSGSRKTDRHRVLRNALYRRLFPRLSSCAFSTRLRAHATKLNPLVTSARRCPTKMAIMRPLLDVQSNAGFNTDMHMRTRRMRTRRSLYYRRRKTVRTYGPSPVFRPPALYTPHFSRSIFEPPKRSRMYEKTKPNETGFKTYFYTR